MGYIPSDPSQSPLNPQENAPQDPVGGKQEKSFELPKEKLPIPSHNEIREMDLDTYQSKLIAFCKNYQQSQSPDSKQAALKMSENFNVSKGAIDNNVGPEKQFEIQEKLQEFFSQCSLEQSEGKQSQEVSQNLSIYEQRDFSNLQNSVKKIFDEIKKHPRFYR